MNKVLDSILLGDNACEEFYKWFEKEEFRKWILNILPEIEKCEETKQDNPWHIYNCLDHILKSVENINKQTKGLPLEERRMLAYVMFLHDIGKPECYIRRYSKLYGREVDSFFAHNKASKRIAERVLPSLGFDYETREKMELLIQEHDVFMFITLEPTKNQHHKVLTPELLNEKINEFSGFGNGKKLLGQLIMVGRADSLAQNPKMTAKSLRLLDRMQLMLDEKNKNCSNKIIE